MRAGPLLRLGLLRVRHPTPSSLAAVHPSLAVLMMRYLLLALASATHALAAMEMTTYADFSKDVTFSVGWTAESSPTCFPSDYVTLSPGASVSLSWFGTLSSRHILCTKLAHCVPV